MSQGGLASNFNPRRFHRRWYWLTPVAYLLLAVALGLLLPQLDRLSLHAQFITLSVASELAILSSIASGMMALTGIVFSLLFIMVQVGGGAYSPRLVYWLAHDPIMRHALGVFTGTFVFALMGLGTIDYGGSGRVPAIAAGTAFVWLGASILLLIAMVERVSRLYVTNILKSIGERGRAIIEELYPDVTAPAPHVGETETGQPWQELPITQHILYRGGPQVVAALDIARLIALASKAQAIIEVNFAVGDFVSDGSPLAAVRGGQGSVDPKAVQRAILLGQERTLKQDPKYALRLLVDVAIRALSPAVNDPTTAVQALNQIDDLLRRLGRVHLEIGQASDRKGRLRLVYRVPVWDDFLDLALLEIMYYGANSVQVMRRMGALLEDLEQTVVPSRREQVQIYAKRLRATTERSFKQVEFREEAQAFDRQGIGLAEPDQESRRRDIDTAYTEFLERTGHGVGIPTQFYPAALRPIQYAAYRPTSAVGSLPTRWVPSSLCSSRSTTPCSCMSATRSPRP